MTGDPELRIAGEEVTVRVGRKTLARAAIGDFVASIARASSDGPDLILPSGVRIYRPRGSFVGVAVEIAPQARRVRWLEDDSKQPFGNRAENTSNFYVKWFIQLWIGTWFVCGRWYRNQRLIE